MDNFETSKTFTLRDKDFNITSDYYILGVWKSSPDDILVKVVNTKNIATLVKKVEPTSNTNIVSVQLDDIYFITNENFTEVDADFFRDTSKQAKEASKVLAEELRNYTKQIPHLDAIEQALLNTEKYKEAWEIVKEKNVNILILKLADTVDEYNDRIKINSYKLTQKEFNLLKEVLEND